MADSFIQNIDVDKVNMLISQTTMNVAYFNNTCAEVIKKYSESLDNLMSDLYIECIKESDPSTDVLEKYYLELSNMIYFMMEKLEKLGVYADMSKSATKEIYSKAYLSAQVKDTVDRKNKTTVAECQAQADLASQYESVVGAIYDHAYKVVKGKIDSAKDMMNTLRKILSVKSTEMQLSMYTPQPKISPKEDRTW